MTPDVINGAFILISGALLSLNVIKILKDKAVRGVSPWPTGFFFLWAIWDFYYYPHLGQWWSLYASILAGGFNGTWLFLWFKYRNNP